MRFDGRWKVGLGRWSPHASWHLHGLDFLLVSCELALIWEEGKEAEVLRPEICAQSNIKNGVRFRFSKLLYFIITSQKSIISMPPLFVSSIHHKMFFTESSARFSVSDD